MPWIVFAIISIFTSAVVRIWYRVLMKDDKSDPISYAILFQFILAVISFITALIFGRFLLPNMKELGLPILISSLLWAAVTVLSFQAVKLLSAGDVTILSASSSLVSIALGILLLKEAFSFHLAFGALLIFIAICIVNSERLSLKSRRGIALALISALLTGIAIVNDATIVKHYDAFSYTAVGALVSGVILLVIFPKKLFRERALYRVRPLQLMVIFCILSAVQTITYYLAYQGGAPISELSPLSKVYVILTVILAAIFLNERGNLGKKILASVIVSLGVLLLR